MISSINNEIKAIIVFVFFYFIFWFSALLHESGHYIVVRIAGIPPSEIKWIWYWMVPAGISVPRELLSSDNISFFNYAGGIFSGILLLVISIFSWIKYRGTRLWTYWWLGALTIGFSLMEFYEGYREGSNDLAYKEFAYLGHDLAIIFVVIAFFIIFRFRKNIVGFLRTNLITSR